MSNKGTHKVVIIGGGVAGLSAAHELAERGFDVEVYERRSHYGGKAASVTIGGSGNPYTTGPRGLPGEHGFRFFPGWYRHLPDTMKRIPYQDKTVHDNLVTADTNLLVDYDREPVKALLRFPTSLAEFNTAAAFPGELLRLGLTAEDLRFFFGKLWTFLTSAEERRIQEFDNQTWWEFMDADNRSRAFRDYLVVSATRNTVAAKPREVSAYTIGKVVLQTLMDTLTPQTAFDRVLNGPTNEVWIEPWLEYLRGLGVKFVEDAELDSIELNDQKVASVRFVPRQALGVARAQLDFLVQVDKDRESLLREFDKLSTALASGPSKPSLPLSQYLETLDRYWPPLTGDPMSYQDVEDKGSDSWESSRSAAIVKFPVSGSPEIRKAVQEKIAERKAEYQDLAIFNRLRDAASDDLARATSRFEPVTADFFVFALPVEQMAYYVHRSETLQQYDPSLRQIILLSEHVDWMAGIQFYLKDVVNITRGHIDLLDSEWALTAISQVQFWKDFDFRQRFEGTGRQVRSILSVDISAWDRRGRFLRKEAYNCTREEIAMEVWYQLKSALNRPGKADVLRDEMLLGWPPTQEQSDSGHLPTEGYFLDDSIVGRLDRKKQALYDKFQAVRFSAAELIRKQSQSGRETDPSFMYGKARQLNAEPLLVNRVGSQRLRPSATTQVSNMMLAADYVRTNTDLATMEGANEAARAAVNEILAASGSRERPCEIWPLREPGQLFRKIDAVLFRRGQKFQDTYADIPVRLAAGAAETAVKFAAQTFEKLVNWRK